MLYEWDKSNIPERLCLIRRLYSILFWNKGRSNTIEKQFEGMTLNSAQQYARFDTS